jgi:hypothetical protein
LGRVLHISEPITFREALQLLDIRMPDHLIVAGGETVSFAKKGPINALAAQPRTNSTSGTSPSDHPVISCCSKCIEDHVGYWMARCACIAVRAKVRP